MGGAVLFDVVSSKVVGEVDFEFLELLDGDLRVFFEPYEALPFLESARSLGMEVPVMYLEMNVCFKEPREVIFCVVEANGTVKRC